MHVNYTQPNFAQMYFTKYDSAKKLFESHPTLSQKQELLESMSSQNIPQLGNQLSQFLSIAQQEHELWESITFDQQSIPIHNIERKELHKDEKEFVKKHSESVKEKFPDLFTRLEEYAIISEAKKYKTAHQDYQKFQQAVDAMRQIDNLKSHINTQAHLARKIKTKLQGQAHNIHEDVQQLKDSHDGQLGILARMPKFSLLQ